MQEALVQLWLLEERRSGQRQSWYLQSCKFHLQYRVSVVETTTRCTESMIDSGLCNCREGRMDAKGSHSDCKEDGALRKHFSLHPALPSHRLISAVEATLLVRVGEAHETFAEARGERGIRIRRLSTTTALHYP